MSLIGPDLVESVGLKHFHFFQNLWFGNAFGFIVGQSMADLAFARIHAAFFKRDQQEMNKFIKPKCVLG